MRKIALLATAVLALGACDKSKAELEKTVVQLQAVSAEKDSLLKDVMATQQFISEVNTEIARVKSPSSTAPVAAGGGDLENPTSPAEARARILTRIKELTDRLTESEARLAASRERVRKLGGDNAALQKQLAQFDSTIASFKVIVDNQKAEIASLTEQVSSLRGENTQLKAERAQLTTEKTQLTENVSQLTSERNTVYYVIGTKDELRKKGIIVKKGGVLGAGATDLPATSLDPALFTAIDKTKVAEIALPNPDKTYRILSRQDAAALENAADKDQRVRGAIRIRDAERFWSASKFLIVVQQ